VTPDTDRDGEKKIYAYDPHLDPQLVWAGKAEHTSFEVPTISLHVHERIDPHTIIEAVERRNGEVELVQPALFEMPEQNPPLRQAIGFYEHEHSWSNRLIAGDSLLVMNSLLEKEGLAGKVQMVYIDPPYGIRYGSNFQPFVNRRDVKDGRDEDLNQEPEMILTSGGDLVRCEHCRRVISLARPHPQGRKRRRDKRFCDDACRQAHHRSKKKG
jgi:adenine-specific DNA-methyltransferase